jgi:tetratricopeptide (TPR) repeat protein
MATAPTARGTTPERGVERPWVAPLIAGLVALVLRLLYVHSIRGSPLFDAPVMDAEIHDGWARGLYPFLYKGVPYFRAPLYPWLLSWVYAIDSGYMLPRILQALLSAATVALVADLGRRIGGGLAGLWGGLLLAICWPAIYFTGELLFETLAVFLSTVSLWLLVRAAQQDRRGPALAGALVLGIAAIARPTALAFVPVLVALPLWVWPRLGLEALSRRRGRSAGLLVLLALLPGLAVTVRNGIVGRDWVFIASQGGVNFYIGNNLYSDGRTAVVPGTRATWLGGYEDTMVMAQRARGRPLQQSEVSSYFVEQGLAFWKDHPGAALRLYLRKLRLLLGAGERGNNLNLQFWRAQSPLLRLPVYTSWAVLFAFGVTGIALCRRKMLAAPLWGFLAVSAAVVLLFFVNERFRLPLTTTLAAFAGIPMSVGSAAFALGRWRTAFSIVGILTILLVGSELDRIGFTESRIEADAYSRHTIGNAYLRKGKPERAIDWYRDALDVAQRYRLSGAWREVEPMVRCSLADAYLKTGKDQLAEEQLRQAEALAPDDPQVALKWAELLVHRDQRVQAIPYYRKALQRSPNDVQALVGLGWAQIFNGAHSTAIETFRRALALAPNNAQAHAGLGVAFYDGAQNFTEAERELRRALELDNDIAIAHRYMGEICRLGAGSDPAMHRRMVYHLREVLRIEPNNLRVLRWFNRAGISQSPADSVAARNQPSPQDL